MSQHKLAFFTMLAFISLFSMGKVFDFRPREANLIKPDSKSRLPRFDSDKSRSYPDQTAKSSVRSQIDHAHNEMSPAIFLPVQSKNPDEVGLGKVLVASRNLGDPNFAKTVVLLVQYDSEGVVGLMVNRRTNVPVSRVFNQIKAAKDVSDPVYAGGPVDMPTVFALQRSQSKVEGAQQILGGIYLISTKAQFEQILSKRPDPATFHVYLGYAGWNRDQLRQEVKLGAWFIFQGDTQTVFNANPDSLWSQMIRQTELQVAKCMFSGRELVAAKMAWH